MTAAAADPVSVPTPKDQLAVHWRHWANLVPLESDASKRRIESIEGAIVLVGFERNPALGLLSGALLTGAPVFVHVIHTDPAQLKNVVFPGFVNECLVKSISIEDGILVARLSNSGPPKDMKASADGIV